jgi:adenine-specific DNA-methyltransferase
MIKEEEFNILNNNNGLYWSKNGDGLPCSKIYLHESNGQIPNDFWDISFGTNQEGCKVLEKIFDKRIFEFSKSITLIKNILNIGSNKDDIILDFFAGSGTTAHAVLDLNKEDGGNRKFICVQLPEPTDSKSEAHKAGYKNIAEITKERIKRVITKLDININYKEITIL